MKMAALAFIILLLISEHCIAEEWVTNGRTYHNVKVVCFGSDIIFITYDDAKFSSLKIASLSLELQKRLYRDPQLAALKALNKQRYDLLAISEIRKHVLHMSGVIVGGVNGTYLVKADEADSQAVSLRNSDDVISGNYAFTLPYDADSVLHGKGGLCYLITSRHYETNQSIRINVYYSGNALSNGHHLTRYSNDPLVAFGLVEQ